MPDTLPIETTAPSLASRVGALFDAQVESKAISFATPAEPVTQAPASAAPAIVPDDDSDTPVALEPADDAAETPADEGAPDPAATDAPDAEFAEALTKQGVPVSLDDLPDEARPLVQKKLKDLERGFTKAMQEARGYRVEKAEFDAERRYQTEKPEQYFADKLLADPKLIERVNEEIQKRDVPAYREAVAKERETDQKLAKVTAAEQVERELALSARADHVEAHTQAVAKAAGIPFAFVEEAVALAISGNPEMSDADVTRIVTEKAKVYKQHIGANKGAAKRELTKTIASDAKTAGIPAVPATAARSSASRAAASPTASTESKPLTLREKLNATLDERAAA